MTTTQLFAQLESAHNAATPELALDKAVSIFLEAKRQIAALVALQDAVKDLVGDVMMETNQTFAHAAGGTVEAVSAGKLITYNGAGVEKLGETFPEVAALLAPHRKVTTKKAHFRITGCEVAEA